MGALSGRGNNLPRQQFEQLRSQVQDLLMGFEKTLRSARKLAPKDSALKDLTEKHQETQRRWEAQCFQVAVLALVKSGKSTLINAWLGDEYLPAANTPETTRIVRVRHHSLKKGRLRAGDSVLAQGAAETNAYLRTVNKEGRESGRLPATDELVLEAPLMALQGNALGEQRFELLDTPGPNEAGTSALRNKVEQVLDAADIIVYVLDYTKLKTAEEQTLLELLKEMRPELLRRCSERLFFVVNKVDQENRNGLTPKETATYVAQLIQRVFPGIALTPERVVPVAAEFALLARIVEHHEPSEKVLRDFSSRVFGLLNEDATLEECRPQAPKLLERSKVTRLEEEVLSFVYQQRGRLMLEGFLDTVGRCVTLLGNHLKATQGALKKDHEELIRRKGELEKDLERIQVGLQGVDDATKQFQAQTEEWVRNQFGRFKTQARDLIWDALTPTSSRKIPERLASFISRVRKLVKGTDGSAEETRQRILMVNQTLMNLLNSEFEDFRHKLEGEAHERQRALTEELQKLINPLARRIEKEVGKALNVSLKPVQVRMPELPLAEFHQELRAQLHRLIQSTSTQVPHTTQRRHVVRPKGFCRDEQVEMVNVTTYSVETSHSVSGQELLRLWTQQLDELTQTSVQTARGVIEQMTRQTTKRVRKELKAYADSFMQILERELQESESGSVQREGRLRKVEALLGEVEALTSGVEDCTTQLGTVGRDGTPEAHDVFVCYDSSEQMAVRKIAEALKARGLKVWVDFETLRPGQSFQRELEQQIKVVRSVAVVIGKNGLTYWQELERQAFQLEHQRRGCPIIPVLLEDCGATPELPLFLAGLHRVDFRNKEPEPLEQLVQGIRGT